MPPRYYKKKPSSSTNLSKDPVINTSATFLVIVESPSKCKKIESFLGPDYCCIASKGHIRTIDGLKSIDTKSTFEPTFTIIEEKAAHVEFMRSILSKFSPSNIILASDDDREGEAIAWHICQVFDLPVETTPRIIFHEITETAILTAVKSPTVINMQVVHAQHARQVLDMLVGYKISPFLWKYLYFNKANSLSAGRCQTPALRLIYDHEQQKQDIETKYKTTGLFFSQAISFDLDHEFENTNDMEQFLEISKEFHYILTMGEQKDVTRSPPKPLNTSKLLQLASNVLHISPKETMSLCQQLYQEGHITYMRTDSCKYAPVFLEQTKQYVLKEFKHLSYLGDIHGLTNQQGSGLSEPHEAIRVTHIDKKIIQNENPRLVSMYRFIWKHTLESCMADAQYQCTPIQITAPMETCYRHTVEVPVFLGWKKVGQQNENNMTQIQNNPSSLLLFFRSIERSSKSFSHTTIESTLVLRNRHSHYTEATLITQLEDLGIGRPSTFATIVDTIQERGYVKRTDVPGTSLVCKDYVLRDNVLEIKEHEKIFGQEKNKLVLQPVGKMTIEFLIEHFQSIFAYEYTKNMEEQLDYISEGKQEDWAQPCKQCYQEIKELSKPIMATKKQTYRIDDTNEFVFERYGPVLRTKQEDGTLEFKPVNKDLKIDMEKLKTGGYRVEDLCSGKLEPLGQYEGSDLFLKNGKYGPYLEWGDRKESIRLLKKPLDQITIEHAIEFLGTHKKNKGVLRTLNSEISIRKGKFGPYAYYKAAGMTKPEFYSIKQFPEGFLACDAQVLIRWIETTHIHK
jgi:DNA topoisomerase-1